MKSRYLAILVMGWFICPASHLWTQEAPASHAEIDALFHRWESVLPEPVTIGDVNGISPGVKCPNHEHNTYGFLTSIATQVPIRKDSDLAALVKWTKHADACIRHIAIETIVKGIGFDRNELTISMSEPEDQMYHQIMVALAQDLRHKKVNYDNALFDGMFVTLEPDDVSAIVSGKWEEEVPPDYKWRERLKFDGTSFQMEILTKSKGQWLTDHEMINKVEATDITTEQQMLITVSQQISPGKKVAFLIWPVSKDVMWFKRSNQFGTWKKFRRTK
jgi:hypothetical protein